MNFTDMINIGDKKYSKNKYSEALEYYLKALNYLDINSNYQVNIRKKIANSYYKQKKFQDTIRHLEILEAITQNDQLIRIITLKSICFYLIGNFDAALKSVKLLDNFSSTLAQRKKFVTQGVIHLRLGQYIDSKFLKNTIENFTKAIDLTNETQVQHKILRNLGICYNELGNFYKSLDYFEQALKLTNNKSSISNTYHEMANTLCKLNEFKKALELLTYCKEISLNNDDIYNLGMYK
ncbi:MAG: tetratricopeptide repeat protein [Halanaerobiales bacterium]|nr:tetratricopeptide repeat protein [Halanaerobiales bacterium]